MIKYLLLSIIFVALATQVVQAQPIEVKWYQIVDGKEVPADFVVLNLPYKAVIKVYSTDYRVVTVEVRADVINWFDQVVASKTVALKPGENTIVVNFVFKHRCVLCKGKPHTNIRGFFIRIDGIYDETNVQNRFLSGTELGSAIYEWDRLKVYVNGKEYDIDACIPVTFGDEVKVCGYLLVYVREYKLEWYEPAPGVKIKAGFFWFDYPITYTDDKGYFEISTTVHDGECFRCPDDHGMEFRLGWIGAYVDDEEVAYYEIDGKFLCPEAPTPTPTPTPPPPGKISYVKTEFEAEEGYVGSSPPPTPTPSPAPVPTPPPNVSQDFMNQMFMVLMMLLTVFMVLIVVIIVIATLIIRD